MYLNFPAVGNRPALRMSWYDGGLRPPRPAGLRAEDQRLFEGGEDGEGIMYVGDKGFCWPGSTAITRSVYPESPKYQGSASARRDEHITRSGDRSVARGLQRRPGRQLPISKAKVLSQRLFFLGCIAQRLPGEFLAWDTEKMRITSSEKANALVDPPARTKYRV